jgi:hypothetical protein
LAFSAYSSNIRKSIIGHEHHPIRYLLASRMGFPVRTGPRQSPRAFLIWEIWAKADICGQNTITATPRISPTAIISVARFGRLCGRLSLILVTSMSRVPSRAHDA